MENASDPGCSKERKRAAGISIPASDVSSNDSTSSEMSSKRQCIGGNLNGREGKNPSRTIQEDDARVMDLLNDPLFPQEFLEKPVAVLDPIDMDLDIAALSAAPATEPCTCKLCLQLFVEPYSTFCGHTFCYTCLTNALEKSRACPTCGCPIPATRPNLTGPPGMIPNHAVAMMTQHVTTQAKLMKAFRRKEGITPQKKGELLKAVLNADLSDSSVRDLIEALNARRALITQVERRCKLRALTTFLNELYWQRHKEREYAKLCLATISRDCLALGHGVGDDEQAGFVRDMATYQNVQPNKPYGVDVQGEMGGGVTGLSSLACLEALAANFVETPEVADDESPLTLDKKYGLRALRNFPALQKAYEQLRIYGNTLFTSANPWTGVNPSMLDEPQNYMMPVRNQSLDEATIYRTEDRFYKFHQYFDKMVEHGAAHKIATLNYDFEGGSGLSIVSSLEFNRDGDQFVVAGVTKKIKVFNFDAIIDSPHRTHAPITQLMCNSKISCVAWNPYHKNILACTDYDGVVSLWDVRGTVPRRRFQEHTKRCWSVAFNNTDPNVLASAGDDCMVKLWSTNSAESVITLDCKVNVCCVAFSPTSSYDLVAGTADHAVNLYDIRNPMRPLAVLDGHKKAVSYVRYLNADELVTASTDSTLRFWDLTTGTCKRILRGHSNEKNFVGLSSNGDHIVCGSENNKAFFYYKDHAEPLFLYDVNHEQNVAPCVQTYRPASEHYEQYNPNFIGSTVPQPPPGFVPPNAAATSAPNPVVPLVPVAATRTTPTAILALSNSMHSASRQMSSSTATATATMTSANPSLRDVIRQQLRDIADLPGQQSPMSSLVASANAAASAAAATLSTNRSPTYGDDIGIRGTAVDARTFVSSVCWRKNSNVVLVANSNGKVFVLRVN